MPDSTDTTPAEQHEGTIAMDDPKLVLERVEAAAEAAAGEEPVTPVASPKWKRNEDGLLENVDYVRNEDDSINWLAMIPARYFVINKQATAETDITKVDDKNKLILLAGFKYLAFLRGYVDEDTQFITTSPHYVSAKTKIVWMGNFETDGVEVGRSGAADAHEGNVSTKKASNGFVATNFFMTIAENRSFVRAVKNFLNISVLGQDEVSIPNEDASAVSSSSASENDNNKEARKNLAKVLEGASLSFENFKNGMTKSVTDGRIKDIDVQSWDSIDDIPGEKLFEVTNFLQQRLKAKAAAAAAAA